MRQQISVMYIIFIENSHILPSICHPKYDWLLESIGRYVTSRLHSSNRIWIQCTVYLFNVFECAQSSFQYLPFPMTLQKLRITNCNRIRCLYILSGYVLEIRSLNLSSDARTAQLAIRTSLIIVHSFDIKHFIKCHVFFIKRHSRYVLLHYWTWICEPRLQTSIAAASTTIREMEHGRMGREIGCDGSGQHRGLARTIRAVRANYTYRVYNPDITPANKASHYITITFVGKDGHQCC